MYFNDSKEDTNIDSEFEDRKILDFSKFKIPLIIIGAIILLIIIIAIIKGNKKSYFISLKGESKMTICKGELYQEPGYTAYDNKKNNLNHKVSVNGIVNSNIVGTYIITYSINNIKTTRTVDVTEAKTYIYLKGNKSITIKQGTKFTDPGFTATDTCDGNVKDKVVVRSNVNTKQKGIYKVIYTVTNSKGITTSETRTVTVE